MSLKLPFRALLAVAALSAACGDDDGDGQRDRNDGGPQQRADASTRDGSLDASRDGATPAEASVIEYDAGGDAGVVKFTRTDGCPADAPLPVNRVRIYPATGGGANLAGAAIEGSTLGSTGAGSVELLKIPGPLPDNEWTELTFENATVYRWIRFFDSQGRNAAIAELEFYHGPVKLSGTAYGTVSAGGNENPFDRAFDGKVETFYGGTTSGGNYIGLDLAGSYIAAAPSFSPAPGALSAAGNVTLTSATPGAQIRYTTELVDPSPTSGTEYTAPINVASGQVSIRAIAHAPCYFPSAVVRGTYAIGMAPVATGQKSYHIGNSLTDHIGEWLPRVVDSTGIEHTFARSSIPGAPIGWLYGERNSGKFNGVPEAARDVPSFLQSYAPIDHMSVQPFSDPSLAGQGPPAVEFFKLAQQASPDLQPWIYAQWTNTKAVAPDVTPRPTPGYTMDPLARGQGDWPPPATPVPNTWEDTTDAMLRHHEAMRDYVDERIPGKKVLICPVGSGLAELKRRIDAGQVPGQTDFFASNLQVKAGEIDELHLNDEGSYMVGLVWYACIYRENPVEKVTIKPDGLTDEVARIYRQIAWEVASSYPHSGITQQ
jgi:hypothetical protein